MGKDTRVRYRMVDDMYRFMLSLQNELEVYGSEFSAEERSKVLAATDAIREAYILIEVALNKQRRKKGLET